MKIVIANGKHEADYIIGMYKKQKHDLIVINSNEETCKYLSAKTHLSVYHGSPTIEFSLESARIHGADLFIALASDDIENYVACKMAKDIFGVKHTIALVLNPKNAEIFKQLGIDSVLSSTALLAQEIKNESAIEDLIKVLSLENNKIIIIEIEVVNQDECCYKTLKELNVTSMGSVSCITRHNQVIIPHRDTRLYAGDKVLIVTKPENKERMIKAFRGL